MGQNTSVTFGVGAIVFASALTWPTVGAVTS
jgi:hypothetical protein